jgi:hypothetical protein
MAIVRASGGQGPAQFQGTHAYRRRIGDTRWTARLKRKGLPTEGLAGAAPWSQRFSSADDPEQDNHDGDHQKDVNETADGVGSDQTKQPQDKQNNGNRIKHGICPFVHLAGSVRMNDAVGYQVGRPSG